MESLGDREVAQLVKIYSVNIRPELEFSEPMCVNTLAQSGVKQRQVNFQEFTGQRV